MTQLEPALLEVTRAGGLIVGREPRPTLDIDMSLWVEPAQFESTVDGLCARLRPLPPDPLAVGRETRVLTGMSSQGIRTDLIFGALPPELEFTRRARLMKVGGQMEKVASLEDLPLMKLVSERERDTEDARRLLKRFHGAIDRDYLGPRSGNSPTHSSGLESWSCFAVLGSIARASGRFFRP